MEDEGDGSLKRVNPDPAESGDAKKIKMGAVASVLPQATTPLGCSGDAKTVVGCEDHNKDENGRSTVARPRAMEMIVEDISDDECESDVPVATATEHPVVNDLREKVVVVIGGDESLGESTADVRSNGTGCGVVEPAGGLVNEDTCLRDAVSIEGPVAGRVRGLNGDMSGGGRRVVCDHEHVSGTSGGAKTDGENVDESVENVATSVENVATSVENVATSVENVAMSVDNVATSVENVATSVENVVEHVENVEESLENVATSVENIATSVDMKDCGVAEKVNDSEKCTIAEAVDRKGEKKIAGNCEHDESVREETSNVSSETRASVEECHQEDEENVKEKVRNTDTNTDGNYEKNLAEGGEDTQCVSNDGGERKRLHTGTEETDGLEANDGNVIVETIERSEHATDYHVNQAADDCCVASSSKTDGSVVNGSKVSKAELCGYMDDTFEVRRLYITVEEPRVIMVRETFPLLFTGVQLSMDFNRITRIDIYAALTTYIEKYHQAVVDLAKSSPSCAGILRRARLPATPADFDVKTFVCLIPALVKEKLSDLVAEMDADSPHVDTKGIIQPMLISRGDVFKADRLALVIEEEVAQEFGDFKDAFVALFASYWVFNMEYPATLSNTYLFFQKAVVKMKEPAVLSLAVKQFINKVERARKRSSTD